MEKRLALRVCVEKNEDIDLLNKYLAMGYEVTWQSDVCQRFVVKSKDPKVDDTFYYSTIVYILEKFDYNEPMVGTVGDVDSDSLESLKVSSEPIPTKKTLNE